MFKLKLTDKALTQFKQVADNPHALEFRESAHYDDGRVMYWTVYLEKRFVTIWFVKADGQAVSDLHKDFLNGHAVGSTAYGYTVHPIDRPFGSNRMRSVHRLLVSTPAQQALERVRERLDRGLL